MELESKAIKNFPDYIIYSDGRVYSLKCDNFLLIYQQNSGYCQVSLRNNSKVKKHSVHRLVADAFIPNPENKPCVNHKDGNKSNNHVNNLEWCTYKENNRHARDTGLNKSTDNQKRAIQKTGRSNKGRKYEGIVQIWYHPEYGFHIGSNRSLIDKYPEQNLIETNLSKVTRREQGRTQHKGWIHIAFRKDRARKQDLTLAFNQGYKNGIHK